MKKTKILLKTFLMFTLIFSTMKVYGNDLSYRAYFTDKENGTYQCEITTAVQPHQDTVNEYYDIPASQKDANGWVAGTDDNSLTGGSTSFASAYYVFQPLATKFSQYNSGFSYGQGNGANINIYYDSYSGEIGNGFDNIYAFNGVAANVPQNQGTRVTDDYLKMYKGDSTRVQPVRWKVEKLGDNEYVVITVNRLTDTAIKEIIAKFGESTLNNPGIRFSNILRTLDTRKGFMTQTYNGLENHNNMDAAWVFFQGTTGYWYGGVRGFAEDEIWTPYATGTYKNGASVANEYDNKIKIPTFEVSKVKRDIYINHVDQYGNVIPGFAHTSLNMSNPAGTTRANTDPKQGYQEHYQIQGNEVITVAKSDITQVGDDTLYEYTGGKCASGLDLASAQAAFPNSTNTWSTDTRDFATNTNKKNDVVVINLIYTKTVLQHPPALDLVGRLEFINRKDAAFTNATTGHDTDYIPSTKELTPYAQDAYPYVVRGIRYDTKTESGSSSATITISIDYSYQYWVFEHHDTAATPPATGTVCTSACKYYSYTGYGSLSKSYTYTVPYKHTYFDITNFKMYRILKLLVYDDTTNAGGTLFGGGTYTVNPSTTYNNRFDASRGKVDDHVTVTFPGSSYSLTSVYKSAASPGSGESAAKSAAQSALDAVTAKIAADHQNLTITYDYDNDYVNLDSMDSMLNRNLKNWSEHITAETNTQRDLDSTKSGTGQVNGSTISYTSNLMSFMKPTTKLTTDADFTPNYQKVPVNRENGERILRGKIYYSLVTDSKYNVGSDSFMSTDQTYNLNTLGIIRASDLGQQTKDYKDSDVNKVNVLTPIQFGSFELVTTQKVDHTEGAGDSTILQKNAEFTINPTTATSTVAGYNVATGEFVKGYYFTFDFNIIYNGQEIPAYQSIYLTPGDMPFKAKTTDSFGSGAASQMTNTVKIVAVTTNITDALKQFYDAQTYSNYKYLDSISNKVRTTATQNQVGLLTRNDIINDAYHAVYKTLITKNVGRIFDFAVTDCTDLAFKDVFRKTTSTAVNQSTGTFYYSGYKYWNLYSSDYNDMEERTGLGTNPQLTLPLGPYKNTDTRNVSAPKMGYRISFDLKTTGYIASNNSNDVRTIQIQPTYYYISKDGKTFDNNIKLYYQNSSGNYVTFVNSGYSIYFKPNDGYRYLRNQNVTDSINLLSSKLEKLDVSSTLVLGSKEMTTNNTSFIQAWYGEFKLPNSTIAISNAIGNAHNNINNPYTDGYIGVIFNIKCIDQGGFTVSYNTDDKSASSRTNTSQWDYEGYMNFKTPGSALANPIKYQLERDVWTIDNNMYQKIKGTVVLFDLDNRASNDFE